MDFDVERGELLGGRHTPQSQVMQFENLLGPLEDANLAARRDAAESRKEITVQLLLPSGQQVELHTFAGERVLYAKRQAWQVTGASSRAAAASVQWTFCEESLQQSKSFSQYGIEDGALVEVATADHEQVVHTEQQVVQTAQYLNARIGIRYTCTQTIMFICFVSALVVFISRLSAGFSGVQTGWKSFSAVGVLLVLGWLASAVYSRSSHLSNYLQPVSDLSLGEDASLVTCSVRLARGMLAAYVSFIYFAVYCVHGIPEEINEACAYKEKCQFRDYQISTMLICTLLLLVAIPALFLLLLGPVADIALGVGRVRTRVGALIGMGDERQLERTSSGNPEAHDLDRWIFVAASFYESSLRKYKECVSTLSEPCSLMTRAAHQLQLGPRMCLFAVVVVVLLCVAWPLGLAFAPITLLAYFGSLAWSYQRRRAHNALRPGERPREPWDIGHNFCFALALVAIAWLIFYLGWIYPDFCPERFDNTPCAVSSVLIGIFRVLGFVMCMFNKDSVNCHRFIT